jgi:hypothetical protein
MVLICPRPELAGVMERLAAGGEAPWVLGELVPGEGVVRYR